MSRPWRGLAAGLAALVCLAGFVPTAQAAVPVLDLDFKLTLPPLLGTGVCLPLAEMLTASDDWLQAAHHPNGWLVHSHDPLGFKYQQFDNEPAPVLTAYAPLEIELPGPAAQVTVGYRTAGLLLAGSYARDAAGVSAATFQQGSKTQELTSISLKSGQAAIRGVHLDMNAAAVTSVCYTPADDDHLPDLSASITGPSRAAPGEDISQHVKLEVYNHGSATALGYDSAQAAPAPLTLYLVLSARTNLTFGHRDPPPASGDAVLLDQHLQSDGLDPDPYGRGRAYNVTARIPADLLPGVYCLGVIVDAERVIPESDETNNTACHMIEIAAAAPTPALAPQPCVTAPFADVPVDHAACPAIRLLAEAGVVNGLTPTTYGPDEPVTRAQMAKLLVEALGFPAMPGAASVFTDVTGHWAFVGGWPQRAVAAGMINGYPDLTFKPDDPVKRAEAVKMAAGAAPPPRSDGAPLPFKPVPNPPLQNLMDIPAEAWYHDWVVTALQADLVGADSPFPLFTGATFAGERTMNRAEAAQLLANLLAFRSH